MMIRLITAVLIAFSLSGCRPDAGVTAGTPLQVKGLNVVLPAGWKVVPPASQMRLAQAAIEGPGGPAELAVFHFGAGQGGDIEANVQRWLGQIAPRPGSEPQRKVFEANDLRVTWVDAEGTLQAGQMGVGPAAAQTDARLLGAVVEGPGGPWFFKATGPDATLGPQRIAFLAMLQGATVAAPAP